jgi:hypothetical protein
MQHAMIYGLLFSPVSISCNFFKSKIMPSFSISVDCSKNNALLQWGGEVRILTHPQAVAWWASPALGTFISSDPSPSSK